MSRKKQSFTMILLILAVLAFGGWISHYVDAKSADYYYKVKRNIDIFGKIYGEISLRYVEEIEPEKFIRAGIDGMLNQLDPYTVFIEKDDNAEISIMTKGKYGGLGMRIAKRGDWPIVVEPPFPNSPAARARIKEGDIIAEIDGESTKPLTVSETARRLRGKVGTEVTIKVKREGVPELLEFRLTRAEIKIEDINYKKVIKDSIGYIKLTHFSKNAGREVYNAIRQLNNRGMKSLILDLRNNPGGLLESAVAVADNFIEKGQLIVSTRGRTESSNHQYNAKRDPIFGQGPLVVLVNGASASASEIVAGTIQDLDRGVVIGNQTFGKGLVQTLVSVGKDVALKMTTAKYYIPSGRLIQKLDVFKKGREKVFSAVIDSVAQNNLLEFTGEESKPQNKKSKKAYKTALGRIVYGGGGITPDIIIEAPQYNRYMTELEMKSMFFNFGVLYSAKHSELSPDFQVNDQILEEFKNYLREKKFDYKPRTLITLEKFEEVAKEGKLYDSVDEYTLKMKAIIEAEKEKSFERNKDFITKRLKQEIAAKIWGTDAEIEASFDTDGTFRKAIEIISDKTQYSALLRPDTKSSD